MEINDTLLQNLFNQAEACERKRMNHDLRTSSADGSQRMLNALLPGTDVCIHRHPLSSENVILIKGRIDEVFYDVVDGELKETTRYHLNPSEGIYGCQVPKGVWHTVEVFEPSIIYEAKDGRYGQDGSESIEEYLAKQKTSQSCNSCGGDLKQQITYLIGMERQSGSMDAISPLYVSRMLNVPIEEVEQVMKEMSI